MEILEIDPFEKASTVRDKYEGAAGQAVTRDFFLFCCLEELATCRSLGDRLPSSSRWPARPEPVVGDSGAQSAFEQHPTIFEDLLSWYADQYPILAGRREMDYGVCAELVPVFAFYAGSRAGCN